MNTSSGRALPAELYSAEQVRQIDASVIARGVPGFSLMSRAGTIAFDALLQNWPSCRNVLVLAGPGNNGGDGYVLARLAHQYGLRVVVFQCGPVKDTGGAAHQARQEALGSNVAVMDFSAEALSQEAEARADVVLVDALLGTGSSGAARGIFGDAVRAANESRLPILALDLPTGLCATTGRAWQEAIMAQVTVTFIGLKQGLLTGRGPRYCGRIYFHDLDIAADYPDVMPLPSARRIDMQSVATAFRPRHADAHKGSHGHVLVAGGDCGFGGAALLTAEAAARSGAGLTSLVTRPAHVAPALARRPELMVQALEDLASGEQDQQLEALLRRASVIAVGPGLGTQGWGRALLQAVLRQGLNCTTTLVLDADALNLLAETRDIQPRSNWILTPHPGEAARLLGCSVEDVETDRFAAVRQLQQRFGGACLLKGAGSLICFVQEGRQQVELCTEGNPGMASGGMGDVLSGIIAAFAAQGLGLADSLRTGVCVHGEAADRAAGQRGQRGLLASDLFAELGGLIN